MQQTESWACKQTGPLPRSQLHYGYDDKIGSPFGICRPAEGMLFAQRTPECFRFHREQQRAQGQMTTFQCVKIRRYRSISCMCQWVFVLLTALGNFHPGHMSFQISLLAQAHQRSKCAQHSLPGSGLPHENDWR
jgi:hypothetical protein